MNFLIDIYCSILFLFSSTSVQINCPFILCIIFKKSKKFKTSCLFYVSYFKFLCNYFFKFIIHKMNSKIILYIKREDWRSW
jgi:hypothetical protein